MAGLYLHIPFCKQRCIYCDFYFVTSQKLIQEFVHTLKREIAYQGTFFGPKLSLGTIYFGGGTPSLLPPAVIAEIMEAIDAAFDTSCVRERSFELNPDDVDKTYLQDLHGAGIDRLSIGIQSFFEDDLRWMNRAHSANEAASIVDIARAAGFDNFSVDLIFGLPEQETTNWAANLDRAVSLDIPHLSTYGLTVEPQTPLFKQVNSGKQQQLSERVLSRLYQQTLDKLRMAGYEHYEVSSFSKPGCRSQHNQLYWQHTNYLGLGPSAHSFWQAKEQPASRWANVRNLKQYTRWSGTESPPEAFREVVSPAALANEFIMLRLRTRDGLDLNKLASDYGTTLPNVTLHQLLEKNLAQINNGVLSLTDSGLLICDAITERFFV